MSEKILEDNYNGEPWFSDIQKYIEDRWHAIEFRLFQTFRYVQPHPRNRDTFSYEFASILRDCGSVFASTLAEFVKNTNTTIGKDPGIKEFCQFLKADIPNISFYGVRLIPLTLENYTLRPYYSLVKARPESKWWDGYNSVKHGEMGHYDKGNLGNVINAMGAVAILCNLMGVYSNTDYLVHVIGDYSSYDLKPDDILFPDSV